MKATGPTPRRSSSDTLAPPLPATGKTARTALGRFSLRSNQSLDFAREERGESASRHHPQSSLVALARRRSRAPAHRRPLQQAGGEQDILPWRGTGGSCTPRNRPNCTKVPLAPDRSFDNTAQVTDALRVARTAFQQCRSVTMRAMMPMHRRGNTLQDGGCAGGCCVSGDAGTVPCCATGAFPGDGPILHDWPFGARR